MRSVRPALIAGVLAAVVLAMAPGARAAICQDNTNPDCPSPPSEAEFLQLADDTATYFQTGPIRTELVAMVGQAQDALHPTAPIHPPVPVRSYHLLGGYLNQVQALAGRTNGATEAGTVILTREASALRSRISAAYPEPIVTGRTAASADSP